MDNKGIFSKLRQHFGKQTSDSKKIDNYLEEHREIINKYCLLGTDDVNKMVGKVGFIGPDGRYFPVRPMGLTYSDFQEGMMTHTVWAIKYLQVIYQKGDNIFNPVDILIRKYRMAMISEIIHDDGKCSLEMVCYNDEPTESQVNSFALLDDSLSRSNHHYVKSRTLR